MGASANARSTPLTQNKDTAQSPPSFSDNRRKFRGFINRWRFPDRRFDRLKGYWRSRRFIQRVADTAAADLIQAVILEMRHTDIRDGDTPAGRG